MRLASNSVIFTHGHYIKSLKKFNLIVNESIKILLNEQALCSAIDKKLYEFCNMFNVYIEHLIPTNFLPSKTRKLELFIVDSAISIKLNSSLSNDFICYLYHTSRLNMETIHLKTILNASKEASFELFKQIPFELIYRGESTIVIDRISTTSKDVLSLIKDDNIASEQFKFILDLLAIKEAIPGVLCKLENTDLAEAYANYPMLNRLL